MTSKEYSKMASMRAKKSPSLKNCVWAFLVGGGLCAAAQVVILLAGAGGMDDKNARLFGSFLLIGFSVLLTALNVFDNVAKHAGAGTIVPITGFANGVASAAIEYQKEGQVFGIGCKIFTIAGPVILYGLMSSWVLGLLYWIGMMTGARM